MGVGLPAPSQGAFQAPIARLWLHRTFSCVGCNGLHQSPHALLSAARVLMSAAMFVHHIALRTHRFAEVLSFYTEVLGLTIARQVVGTSAWLPVGGTILMIERADADEPAPNRGKELIAFGLSPSELEEAVTRLEPLGVVFEGRTEFTHYFRDPEGRRLALSAHPGL